MQSRDGDELSRIPFLRTWFRTSRAVVMFLTNGTVQVIIIFILWIPVYFYVKLHTKLLLDQKVNHLSLSDQLFQRPYKGYFVSIDGCCHIHWSSKKCSHNEAGLNWEIWMQWRVSPKVTVHLRQSGQHAEGAKIIIEEILRKNHWKKNYVKIAIYIWLQHMNSRISFTDPVPNNSANQEPSFVFLYYF